MEYYCNNCGELMYPGNPCPNCGDTSWHYERTPDSIKEGDWYAEGEYQGDLEREEG